jgi:hypothetical protein
VFPFGGTSREFNLPYIYIVWFRMSCVLNLFRQLH